MKTKTCANAWRTSWSQRPRKQTSTAWKGERGPSIVPIYAGSKRKWTGHFGWWGTPFTTAPTFPCACLNTILVRGALTLHEPEPRRTVQKAKANLGNGFNRRARQRAKASAPGIQTRLPQSRKIHIAAGDISKAKAKRTQAATPQSRNIRIATRRRPKSKTLLQGNGQSKQLLLLLGMIKGAGKAAGTARTGAEKATGTAGNGTARTGTAEILLSIDGSKRANRSRGFSKRSRGCLKPLSAFRAHLA